MKRTAVRELLKLTTRSEMISFAGGLPAPDLFPLEAVRAAAQSVLARTGAQALQYGPTEGLGDLRDWIADRFSGPGVRLGRENVLIVSGGQQGLDLIGRVLLDPGDRVLVENPTYLALLSAWRPLGVEFLPVASDDQGMRLDEIPELLQLRPKLLYTIPNFQNPQGTTLKLERRQQLLRLLQEAEVGLVEDDPYGELRYDGESLPRLLTTAWRSSGDGASSNVIYVGTFSKVLMPGLRVGWVIASEEVIDKLVQAKQSADLQTSSWNQYIVWELVRGRFLEKHIEFLRDQYRLRRDAMLAALQKHLPGELHWTHPEGGMFLLLTLPIGSCGTALLQRGLQRNVAFVPGEEFHLNGAGRNTIRLNFSNALPERIDEGIRRLGELLRPQIHPSPKASFDRAEGGGRLPQIKNFSGRT
jgi:2-aminoadipate transaminase